MKTQERAERIPLKVVRYDLSQLAGMLPVRRMGRFAEVKEHVKREMAATKTGYFGIPAEGPLKDKKERISFETSMKNMFSTQRMEWTVRFSPINNSFLFIRRADLKKALTGGVA